MIARPLLRTLWQAVVLSGTAVGIVAPFVGPAAAAPPSAPPSVTSYTAAASSRLVGVSFTTVPGVLFDQLVDAGLGVTQSTISSLGDTAAFASTPYPSQSVVLAPGLIAGFTGGTTSDLPAEYPLVASTDQSRASDRKAAGPVVLEAHSTTGDSRALATDGVTRSAATTTYSSELDEVVARAESSVASLRVGPALSFEGVRTAAAVVRRADGSLERESSFDVAAITILGQRVALGARGLSVLEDDGASLDPVAGVLEPLLRSLADQGTLIEVVPATEGEDAVTAAGLRITSRQSPPQQLASGLDNAIVEVTVGMASASVSGSAFSLPGGGTFGSIAAPAGAFGAGGPGEALGPQSGAEAGGLSASAPISGPAAAPAAPPTAPAPTELVPIRADISIASVYPLIFLAASAGMGIVNLIRYLGVRNP